MAVPSALVRSDIGLVLLEIVKRVVVRGEPTNIDAYSRYIGRIRARVEMKLEESRRHTRGIELPVFDEWMGRGALSDRPKRRHVETTAGDRIVSLAGISRHSGLRS